MVLVDTNVLIDFKRGQRRTTACLERTESESKLAISIVTEMELIVGCRNKNEVLALRRFLGRFEILTLTPPNVFSTLFRKPTRPERIDSNPVGCYTGKRGDGRFCSESRALLSCRILPSGGE